MAAQNKLFQQIIWLADTVYSNKSITLEEIDRKWSQSSYNGDKQSQYGKRTFHRHRDLIMELFGIEIKCNRATNEYYIANDVSGKSASGVRAWIINTFALNNLSNLTAGMQERVIFEEIPEGTRYLTTIVNAMRQNRQLVVSYQGFKRDEPHTFFLAPYCLKVFKQRWYLVGKPHDHPEEPEPRVYALDRVKTLAEADTPFHLPAKFKAETFFENQFGVDRSKTEAERIRIKVEKFDANFLRSLPLHHSQREVEQNDKFSVFEFSVAPTTDFILELRKFGPKLEVLAPQSLRDEFAEETKHLNEMYSV